MRAFLDGVMNGLVALTPVWSCTVGGMFIGYGCVKKHWGFIVFGAVLAGIWWALGMRKALRSIR